MRLLKKRMSIGALTIETTISKPLSWLLDQQDFGQIEIYKKQRVSCWGKKDQQEFIEMSFDKDHNTSMLLRFDPSNDVPYEIGDGGNRATAVHSFVRDGFSISLDNGEGGKVKVYYSELSEEVQNKWRSQNNMSIVELQHISDDKFDDRIDRMNSGTKMQRAEHIRLKLHWETPRCKFLKMMFDRYPWAKNDLRVQGKGDDLICQIVHHVFKTKNKRTTGNFSSSVEELDGGEESCEEEEDGESDGVVDEDTVPVKNLAMQHNRFPYQAAKLPILECFLRKPDGLDHIGETARSVVDAFDALTIVFGMQATSIVGVDKSQLPQTLTSGMRIVDFWAGKIKSGSEFKFFERGMRALVLGNIYDGTPINKQTYESAIIKTMKIYNDMPYSASFDYLQQSKFHEIPEPKAGGKLITLSMKKHATLIFKLSSIDKRHHSKEIAAYWMHLWELTHLTSEHNIKINVNFGRFFEIFGKQQDIENKVREILRLDHVAAQNAIAPP
jgi:hypothetical protein